MTDGANLGVTAARALGTILGGEPEPTDDEQRTPERVEERVRATSLPGDGVRPWARTDITEDERYGVAADTLAHCFLVLADEDPGLLDMTLVHGDAPASFSDEQRADWDATVKGKPRDACDATWDAFCERWPDGDDWIGGASGFQVGFAYNTARFVKGMGVAANPAIVEVAVPEEGGEA